MSEVQVEEYPVEALLNTGSPMPIVSLKFPLETLAKQKRPDKTAAD